MRADVASAFEEKLAMADSSSKPIVGVIMGSKSDYEFMSAACEVTTSSATCVNSAALAGIGLAIA